MDLSKPNKHGDTPAHCAALGTIQEGNEEAVAGSHADCLQVLAEQQVNLGLTNADGDTPAHLAAKEGKSDVLVVLHQTGVDLSAPDSNGDTPADLAVLGGHHDAVVALANNGLELADWVVETAHQEVQVRNKSPTTSPEQRPKSEPEPESTESTESTVSPEPKSEQLEEDKAVNADGTPSFRPPRLHPIPPTTRRAPDGKQLGVQPRVLDTLAVKDTTKAPKIRPTQQANRTMMRSSATLDQMRDAWR